MRLDPLDSACVEGGRSGACRRGGAVYEPPLFALDLVRVGSSIDRDCVWALAAELRRAGIRSVVLPSDRCIGVWDIEVPADVAADAAAIVAGVVVTSGIDGVPRSR
jgi:hypothetical protein